MGENSIHSGHRERLRNRYRDSGLDALDSHQVIELLLSFAVPRRDTNETGHALMREYGSLAAIFDASYEQLMSVEGVGTQSATLLSMVPQLARRYLQDQLGRRPKLGSTEEAGEYAITLFIGMHVETLYLLCLDIHCNLIRAVKLQQGTLDEVPVYPRMVVEQALRYNAKNIILAHNHPAGSLRPSRADVQVTQNVLGALDGIGINLLDHLIIGREGFFSFVQNDVIKRGFTGRTMYVAEDTD